MLKKSPFNHYLNVIALVIACSPLISFASANPIVDIQTTQGLITVELAADKAPLTTQNFLTYVGEGFYDDTLFHRVIDNFLIQGGGYSVSLELKENHEPIALELGEGLQNIRGSIAMARLSNPDSARSQFFINTVDNLSFDNLGYAVFGKVIQGMQVVDTISAVATESVPTEAGLIRNVPEHPIIIEAMRPRTGQLEFVPLNAVYTAGEVVRVRLEETMHRLEVLDLWVAVLSGDGLILYITEKGFSSAPAVFKELVPVNEISHPVLNFTLPQGLTGEYALLAVFNKPGAGIEDLMHSLRSNIAQISVDFILE
ncbi:peptidylprolyl isomerase [Methyloprofundus sedimenti]|uniref:peptidylprolyl isomerase n=1 Tax=Methyloprofundus sedimenti TaxID=1420851 RepID=UPI0009B6BCC9|nr:peptidylprolyl isomerase [Methyloprofundus sedimenti]